MDTTKLLVASKDVVSCDLDGGKALLDLNSGNYFSMNPSCSFVWTLILQEKSFNDILSAMLEEYDVDENILKADLDITLSSLLENKLIEFKK